MVAIYLLPCLTVVFLQAIPWIVMASQRKRRAQNKNIIATMQRSWKLRQKLATELTPRKRRLPPKLAIVLTLKQRRLPLKLATVLNLRKRRLPLKLASKTSYIFALKAKLWPSKIHESSAFFLSLLFHLLRLLHLNLGKPQVGGYCSQSLQQKGYILQVLTGADLSSWAGDTPTSFENSSRVIPDTDLQEI